MRFTQAHTTIWPMRAPNLHDTVLTDWQALSTMEAGLSLTIRQRDVPLMSGIKLENPLGKEMIGPRK